MAEALVTSVVPNYKGKGKFKKSEHVAFYRQQIQGPNRQYRTLLDSMVLSENGAQFELLEADTQTKLQLILSPCENNSIRILIDEPHPINARYKVKDVITAEPQSERVRVEKQTIDSITLSWLTGRYQVRVWCFPFHIEILCEEEVIATFNPKNKLWFESLQDPKRATTSATKEDHNALWKETFRQFVDYKTHGPSSVGADLRFHGSSHVFGLPEHADQLQLRDTRDSEPYRLYNLDVFAYDLNSPLGLYGSVPFVLAHSSNRTMGAFWLNASETFVNVYYSVTDKDDLTPPVKRRRTQPHTDLHWLSESGVIDCRILLGPQPKQVFSQYAQLTGYQSLPPLFALGYHQCRWNYDDEADVKAVDAGFDLHKIPYDVIWLDIEHTNGKRYFTWDPVYFPRPTELQRHLQKKKRKLVVISDPHIKLDPDWSLFLEARDSGHFVKDREGQIFKGSCWPGESCFLDFTSPATRAWYSRCFSLSNYKGSTSSLFVWNDMNEPSVFDGAEQTMPKDAVHSGGWEHRDLHNLYGFYQQMATAEGLLTRSGGQHRPFVLTRSFFAGSQRFGAVWTGDNVATWDYLKISIPMVLSLSVAGIAFCGADVGGFVQDPDPELLVRWYQAGALTPFFRGHSAKETKRREPWLFGEEVTAAIRNIIQQRYQLLPYWYTLFYWAHTVGQPPLRPLWVEFPTEEDTFTVDNEYMIGGALLACPITDPGVQQVQVLLPSSEEIWYDVQSLKVHKGGRTVKLPVTMDTVPVYQRGGTIICRATGSGSCSEDFQKLPLSLTVALNSQGSPPACLHKDDIALPGTSQSRKLYLHGDKQLIPPGQVANQICGEEFAEGNLYLDDGFSYRYHDTKAFCLRRFKMDSGQLCSRSFSEEGSFVSDTVIKSITVIGLKRKPSTVVVHVSGVEERHAFEFDESHCILTLDNLNLKVVKDWDIQTGPH